MGTLSLTDPVNGTANDATTIANNNSAIKTVVNGNIDTVNLKDPGTGKVYGSTGAGNAAAVFPPGYEITYVSTTASVSIVSTTESAGTSILATGSVTYDGSAVMVEFFSPSVVSDTASAGDQLDISLFEGATQIARLIQINPPAITANMAVPVCAKYRFTPASGTHTYSVTAFVSSATGTPRVVAGPGGTTAYAPAYLRITKV